MPDNEKISSIYTRRVPLIFQIESFQRAVVVFEEMKNGTLPVSAETKKAMQSALKEICTAFSNFIDKQL